MIAYHVMVGWLTFIETFPKATDRISQQNWHALMIQEPDFHDNNGLIHGIRR